MRVRGTVSFLPGGSLTVIEKGYWEEQRPSGADQSETGARANRYLRNPNFPETNQSTLCSKNVGLPSIH